MERGELRRENQDEIPVCEDGSAVSEHLHWKQEYLIRGLRSHGRDDGELEGDFSSNDDVVVPLRLNAGDEGIGSLVDVELQIKVGATGNAFDACEYVGDCRAARTLED